MPFKDHDGERESSYRVFWTYRPGAHLARGFRGALAAPEQPRIFWRWEWEKSELRVSLGSGVRGLWCRRRARPGRKKTDTMAWCYFVRSPACRIRFQHKSQSRPVPAPDPWRETTRQLSVTLPEAVWQELDNLLQFSDGPGLPDDRTVEALTTAILAHWADGWRRSGSWEATCLQMMGHI